MYEFVQQSRTSQKGEILICSSAILRRIEEEAIISVLKIEEGSQLKVYPKAKRNQTNPRTRVSTNRQGARRYKEVQIGLSQHRLRLGREEVKTAERVRAGTLRDIAGERQASSIVEKKQQLINNKEMQHYVKMILFRSHAYYYIPIKLIIRDWGGI